MQRVSSAGLNETLMRSTLDAQSRLAEQQISSSSGLKAQTYVELGVGSSSRLMGMESTTTQLQARADNTQTALDRTESMYSAVGAMIDIVTDLRTTLSALSSDQASTSMDYPGYGQDAVDDLAAQMNLQMDGRYLFAGSLTTEAPVDTSLLATPDTPSSADTAYYLGDDVVQSVQVSDQTSVAYGVTADASGFEAALRTANILANIDSDDPDSDAVTEAYDLATEALEGLSALQGRLSTSAQRLESYQEVQSNAQSLLSDRISDAKDVDVGEVTVNISQYQNILEASYSALGKVSKLSLTEYL